MTSGEEQRQNERVAKAIVRRFRNARGVDVWTRAPRAEVRAELEQTRMLDMAAGSCCTWIPGRSAGSIPSNAQTLQNENYVEVSATSAVLAGIQHPHKTLKNRIYSQQWFCLLTKLLLQLLLATDKLCAPMTWRRDR